MATVQQLFGRIGRMVLRAVLKRKCAEVVAVNDPYMDVNYMAYLLQFDSTHGRFDEKIELKENRLIVNGTSIRVYNELKAENIDWQESGVWCVVDSTGVYTKLEKARGHLNAGAKKVIISAPSENAPMYVMGVNAHMYTENDDVISNASCTTNCAAPLIKLLHNEFGIKEGLMTSIHSCTVRQNCVDGPKKDWRLGRGGMQNIVPATIGASTAVGKVIPELEGKLSGMALRVPVADVSVLDFTCSLEKPTTLDEIKTLVRDAANGPLRGIVGYSEDAIVSSDVISDTHSCTFDAQACIQLSPTFFKLIAWYDNEFAYSHRVVDLLVHISRRIEETH